MRSTTKLGTKNKPISFKIDFENFFAKQKSTALPSSALHLTPIKRKKKQKTNSNYENRKQMSRPARPQKILH